MKIRLLATSDIHGSISCYRYSDRSLACCGLARLANHIHRLKDEYTLLIDNGDVLQGTPLDDYHTQFNSSAMHPMAKALNYLEYDYYNLGNHDFNYGLDLLHHYMKDNKAECLTGNIVENQEAMGADYTIHTFDDDHCIALIGVTTQYIPHWEKPNNIVGISFEDAFDYVKTAVKTIKENEKVDGIVVVYHGGFERDLKTGEPTESLTGENLGYKMAKEIDGIDVILSGHQHRSLATTLFGKTITQTAFNAEELACVDWDLETHSITSSLLKADQEIDEKLLKIIEEEEELTQIWLDQPLGSLKEGDLLVHDPLEARIHKHPMVSFLNEVQMAFSGADVSSQALFNNAVGFNQKITMRDLVSTYVFPNTLVSMKMKGKILKEFLEKCAEYFDVVDGKIGVAYKFLEPKPQHYNYDMVDGVEYTIKVSNPIGQRITELTREGKKVMDNDEFIFVTSNYRASGGGDFDMLKECEVIQEIQKTMVECLAEYIQSHPNLVVDHKDNIKVIL